MKRNLLLVAILAIALTAQAKVEFAYEAGAELVSAYLWRGQYNGGLSLQPNVTIGFEGEHTSLQVGAWGSIGASDWCFNSDTYFNPEVDITASFSCFGVTLDFAHLYFFGNSPFFCWTEKELLNENASSQTELMLGYNFGDMLDFPLYFKWGTVVAGSDFICDYDDNGDAIVGTERRAWSSYMEIGYDAELPFDMTLNAHVAMSPWRNETYYNEKFAVINIGARLEKSFEFDHCSLSVFAEGSINPDGLNRHTAYIPSAGEEKVYKQKLNGVLGLGIWF
ncbi:MAG: hypothetical protein KBS42_06115 [Bacteroidales bacterium]|nr:hypothetical protein [Candidatus Colicola coprequi]